MQQRLESKFELGHISEAQYFLLEPNGFRCGAFLRAFSENRDASEKVVRLHVSLHDCKTTNLQIHFEITLI